MPTELIGFVVSFAIMAGVYAIMSLGLNVHWGTTGLVNLGVAGFFAIGAYTAALVTTAPPSGPLAEYARQAFGLDQPFLVGVLAAAAACGVVAALIGIPTLRLRGDYLAIASIGIAESIRLMFNNERWLANGPQPMVLGPGPLRDLVSAGLYPYVYLGIVLAILAVMYVVVERAVRSPWGRVLRAIRDDEGVAAASGKSVFLYKMQALVLGAMVMGVGGALFAHHLGSISPASFTPLFGTLVVWVALMVGGSGNNRGAILGAFIVWTLWSTMGLITGQLPSGWEGRAPFLRLFLIGLLIVAVLLWRPQGILREDKRASTIIEE